MSELFNHDAEIAVLSIILKNPSKYYELTGLRHGMFATKNYEMIFQSIADLNADGNAASFPILRSYMESTGMLPQVGGEQLLTYLYNASYPEDNISFYENLVIDSYRGRSLIQAATDAQNTVQAGGVDLALSQIRRTLDNLATAHGKEDLADFSDILTAAYGDIQERVAAGGKMPGLTTGFQSLDLTTGGFGKGEVWIVAARSSMGKSAWICNSALKTAKAGSSVAIFSLEMPKKVLIERMLAIETGISISKIRFGNLNQKEVDAIFEATKRLRDLKIVVDSNYSADIDYYTSTVRKLKKNNDLSVTYLDYIQLMAERSTEATHELGRISRGVKLLANELGITSVVVSQLNRSLESRDDKRPTLADLRQSGNLEEDADNVIMLYRDEYYNRESKHKGIIENIIRKQRNGPVGTVMLKFIDESNIIYED